MATQAKKPLEAEINKSLGIRFYLEEYLPALLVFVTETFGMYTFASGQIKLLMFIILHGTVVFLLSLWLGYFILRKKNLNHLLLLWFLTLLLGPFGAFITFLSLSFYIFFIRQSMSFDEWMKNLFPEVDKYDNDLIFQRIEMGWDDLGQSSNMMSFNDVFLYGTITQKRDALTKISNHYKREFSQALMLALKDPSNAIRVKAATVMAKLEEKYNSKIITIIKKLNKDSNNPNLILNLAQIYDSYVYSGILEENRKIEILQQSLSRYEQYEKLVPDEQGVLFSQGRINLQLKNVKQAKEIFKKCVESDKFKHFNLGIWYMECLFYLKQWDKIRELATIYHDQDIKMPKHIHDLCQMWSQGIGDKELKLEINETKS